MSDTAASAAEKRSPASPPSPPSESPCPVRCECGALLARRDGDVIELKCRRCRRRVLLRLLPDGRVDICDSSADAAASR